MGVGRGTDFPKTWSVFPTNKKLRYFLEQFAPRASKGTQNKHTKTSHKTSAQKGAPKCAQQPQRKVAKMIDLVESIPTVPILSKTDPCT